MNAVDAPDAPPAPSPAIPTKRTTMTPTRMREVRAIEYRRLADVAGDLAKSSPLVNVREKHERAAAQWTALALVDERPVQMRPSPPPAPSPMRRLAFPGSGGRETTN
jgi:hypothetical protein